MPTDINVTVSSPVNRIVEVSNSAGNGLLISNLQAQINALNGAKTNLPFVFNSYNLASGEISTGFIPFGYTFGATPNVRGSIINNSGDPIVCVQISGINTSGFYLNATDALATNNYYFQYLATTGLGYYNI